MNGIDQLKKDLTAKEFGRLYLIYGEESYLKEHYKSQMIKAFTEDGFPDFNLLDCEGDNFSYDEFLRFTDGLPMMAQRKLLFINDFPLMKPTGEFKENLSQQLENIPDYLTVVFFFSTLEFKPDKRLNIWKSLSKIATICEVNQAAKADLIAWIKRRFKALNKEISTENADYLVFLCGNLMTNLISEIGKIASGTQSIPIEKRHIDNLASPTIEAKIFDLSEHITGQNHEKAFEILQSLLFLKYEPVAICSVISKQIGRMYGAKLALNDNRGEQYVMKLCGFTSPYPATMLCRGVNKVKLNWLRKAVKLCYQTDLELKSNIPGSERKLELLLCKLFEEQV